MPKEEVREDTYAWVFAANVYVIVGGTFLFAIGLDVYHAAKSVSNLYAGTL